MQNHFVLKLSTKDAAINQAEAYNNLYNLRLEADMFGEEVNA